MNCRMLLIDLTLNYSNQRSVLGPVSNGLTSIFSSDGKLLIETKEITKCWAEHFPNFLNMQINFDENLNNFPHRPILEELLVASSIVEIKKTLKQFTNEKFSGNDGIPAEIYKRGNNLLVRKICGLFSLIWESWYIPQEFKEASIVHLYMHKCNKCECDNHRSTSLLCFVGTILGKIMLNRINPVEF